MTENPYIILLDYKCLPDPWNTYFSCNKEDTCGLCTIFSTWCPRKITYFKQSCYDIANLYGYPFKILSEYDRNNYGYTSFKLSEIVKDYSGNSLEEIVEKFFRDLKAEEDEFMMSDEATLDNFNIQLKNI